MKNSVLVWARLHGGTVFLAPALAVLVFLPCCSKGGKAGEKPGSPKSTAGKGRDRSNSDEGYQRLRTSLRPLLEQEKSVRPDWIYKPLLPGLVETYVVDRQGSFDRVTRSTLAKWGITRKKLDEETMAWFTVSVDPLNFRVFQKDKKPGSPKVAHPDLHGIYTASLILHPSFKEGLKRIFGRWEGLLIAIPSQNRCWVLGAGETKLRKKLKKELEQEFQSSAHPLMDRYLATKKGGGYEQGPPF